MRKPHRCPVCLGNGKVMNGFYGQVGGSWSSSNTNFEPCRSCSGTGVVWDPVSIKVIGPVEVPPFNPMEVPAVTYPPMDLCACPQEVKDGKLYVGDNWCPVHASQVNCGTFSDD